MALKKKLFARRRTFAREEIGANIYKPAGRPHPREAVSQTAQLESHQPGTRKDVKIKMEDKQN
ncbi:hypothetical protein [Thermoanaerobacterium sp. DL9XJH110]|jgi:hypothetical protein|uniref:hypothetical protein n=1 Tax=Thermoanaerobacterium sp. DL9XJH110 TaxID=3386643 RepID=UPI003BB51B92